MGSANDCPRKQDLALPKSIITRLAKGVLPPNTQIQANAILALTKSATVFISHLANAYVAQTASPVYSTPI
jgi:histone H3/H4